jgi:hypothetical protein
MAALYEAFYVKYWLVLIRTLLFDLTKMNGSDPLSPVQSILPNSLLKQVWQLTSSSPQSVAGRILETAAFIKDPAHLSALIRFMKPLVQSLHAWPGAVTAAVHMPVVTCVSMHYA